MNSHAGKTLFLSKIIENGSKSERVLLVCVLLCWRRGCLVCGARFLAYMREARMPFGGAILSCMWFFQTFILGDESIPAMPIWLAVSKNMDPTLDGWGAGRLFC